MIYGNCVKRVLDFSAALIVLAVLLVPFLALAALLAAANRGTPFFRQTRPGRHGKLFRIVKFKTMTDEKDARGELLPDERRLTRAGRLVRSLSLDELPQLFNVLAGQMSFIGPRPLLPADYQASADTAEVLATCRVVAQTPAAARTVS